MTEQLEVPSVVRDLRQFPKSHWFINERGQQRSVKGYATDAFVDHLKTHLKHADDENDPCLAWCSIECAARTFYGRANPVNVSRFRKAGKVNQAFHRLLLGGWFLLIERNAKRYHRVERFRILSGHVTQEERDEAEEQIKRFAERSDNYEHTFESGRRALQTSLRRHEAYLKPSSER
jgi:hypothetical protein